MNNTSCIKTILRTGEVVDFNKIDIKIITPEILATGLENINRWNGHAQLGCRFLHINPSSILKEDNNRVVTDLHHSFLVFSIIKEKYPNEKMLQLQALIHDAGEVFYGDIIGPIKKQLVNFKAIEIEIESKIASRYNIDYPWDSRIKEADMKAQDIEGYLCFIKSINGVNVRDDSYQPSKEDELLFWNSYNMTKKDFITILSKEDIL